MIDILTPSPDETRLRRDRETQRTTEREVDVMVSTVVATISPTAGAVLRRIVDFVAFGLAREHATLRDTLTGSSPHGVALHGLHDWIRRVVAHTTGLCTIAVASEDRDTALVVAVLSELGPCAATLPPDIALSDVIKAGAFPGAAALIEYIVRTSRMCAAWPADDEVFVLRVFDALRQLERHPWTPITAPAAALVRAGRASAEALIDVLDRTPMPLRTATDGVARLGVMPRTPVDQALHDQRLVAFDLPF